MKTYKKYLILASLATLLPIPVGLALLDRFPEQMAIHWGITGAADGWMKPLTAIFLMPMLMLASLWLGAFITLRDPGNKSRNKKPMAVVFWILPLFSNFVHAMMYSLALGAEVSVTGITTALLGVMFAVIGNFMPKMKPNSTMGIRVSWTFSSEENWNATHRFGGKAWVVGGLMMLFGSFLPEGAAICVMLLSMAILILLPILYSWRYYRMQLQRGDAITPVSKLVSGTTKGSLVTMSVILVLIAVFLCTGDLAFVPGETGLTVEADYYTDYHLSYDRIQSLEYREGNVPGSRVGGFESFRLLMGYFSNEELGTYVRYTYDKPESCIVITTNSYPIVLSAKTAEQTRELYEFLSVQVK